MKDGQEKEKEGKEEKKEKEKKKGISEEERKKRDHKLKNLLDPLNDMKKALAVKERSVHKSKKGDSRDRSVHRSSGLRWEKLWFLSFFYETDTFERCSSHCLGIFSDYEFNILKCFWVMSEFIPQNVFKLCFVNIVICK